MPALEPLACRVFRHRETGHEVALVVDRRGTSGGPRELLWEVWLEDAPGSPLAVTRLRYLSTHESRDAVRRAFERQRTLKAAGYEQVR